MARMGFEGNSEHNIDTGNSEKFNRGFEGNDEQNLAEPSTQGGGPSAPEKPTTDTDHDGD